MSGGHSFSPPPPAPPRPRSSSPDAWGPEPDAAAFRVGLDRYGRALTLGRERKDGRTFWHIKRDPHDQRDTSPWIEGVPDDVMQTLARVVQASRRAGDPLASQPRLRIWRKLCDAFRAGTKAAGADYGNRLTATRLDDLAEAHATDAMREEP